MLSATNSTVSSFQTKKYSALAKWNILFDKSPEWISYKPALGLKTYPCYSCKNMFSSKLTFQDHINRRVIIVTYKCPDCTSTFTFHNRCSFLLHTRKHYSLSEGTVNLSNVDISLLPVELAGFARHESVPFLFDEEEEFANENVYINSQFYTPDDTEAGKQIITLRPYNLVFHYSESGENVLMVLKQISSNVPLCEFVSQDYKKKPEDVNIMEPEVKIEPEEEFTIPVISRIESLGQKCSECSKMQDMSLSVHFLGANRPLNQKIFCQICKFIAPTKCSLKAHCRIHENASPFVCPECGKTFPTSDSLRNHMEDTCFHLAKQVRFRCPAQKCGKIFVMPNTYAAHFANHFQSFFLCDSCPQRFNTECEFRIHSKSHETAKFTRLFNCMVCVNVSSITEDKCAEHITWHLQDRERCVYIFTCKHCRSYFRSTTTYAVHKQRCAKVDKGLSPFVSTSCQFCGQKMTFRDKDVYKPCAICKQMNHKPSKGWEEKSKPVCMLCKEEIAEEDVETHNKSCRYNYPVVTVPSIPDDQNDETSSFISDSPGKSDEGGKKKRKRSSTVTVNKKKQTEELQAEDPESFDGTYYCKLCDFKSSERADFHSHIVGHRDVSTAYQCMECGMCFVVKPSLEKHLMHFHKVEDVEEYFAKNDCYDRIAVEELENALKFRQHRGPLKENQCSICLKHFRSGGDLDKHFRTHGMAFLMKKIK